MKLPFIIISRKTWENAQAEVERQRKQIAMASILFQWWKQKEKQKKAQGVEN